MFKSLEIREMKNKTTMKYHYMSIKWLKLKGLTTPNIIKDVEQLKLHTLFVGMLVGTTILKNNVSVP